MICLPIYEELLMFKNKAIKSIPYFAALITGGFFYFLANYLNNKYYDLLINIAAAFFAIPLLYLFYETARSFAHKKLNKEIFDYAKMQVDRELVSIINQLRKIVFTLENKELSKESVNEFLSVNEEDIEHNLNTNKYLGFQVFKHWEFNEIALHDLLKNTFILGKMEDQQIISVIGILKSLRNLEAIQKSNELYIETNDTAKGYKVQSGVEMNPENKKYPDRYILLKHLSEDRFIVQDFGDIHKYNLEKCLKYYKVNNKITKFYAEVILDLLKDINTWLDATGLEFIIDTKMFKMRGKYIT